MVLNNKQACDYNQLYLKGLPCWAWIINYSPAIKLTWSLLHGCKGRKLFCHQIKIKTNYNLLCRVNWSSIIFWLQQYCPVWLFKWIIVERRSKYFIGLLTLSFSCWLFSDRTCEILTNAPKAIIFQWIDRCKALNGSTIPHSKCRKYIGKVSFNVDCGCIIGLIRNAATFGNLRVEHILTLVYMSEQKIPGSAPTGCHS